MKEGNEYCVHCKRQVIFGLVVQGEWAHTSGSHYCQDDRGYTASPLTVAQPSFYGPGDVL